MFVDVLATTAAFLRMTVHQVSLWQTKSVILNDAWKFVSRSSMCLVLSWCVSFPGSSSPFCCFLCQLLWHNPSLWRGWERCCDYLLLLLL